MAVAKRASIQEMNRCFLEDARRDPSVQRLWSRFEHGRIQPGHLSAEFWVQVAEDDDETFHRVADMGMRVQERFPDADIILFVVSPDTSGPGDRPSDVDPEAIELTIRSA